MRLTYAVKEAFFTIQGEGRWSGHPAVFVRFAGCNVWSGREQDRERDTKKGCCATWCDTDFVGTNGQNGGNYLAQQVAALARSLHDVPRPHVVLTGGEPSLVVDPKLVDELHAAGCFVQVETNGSRRLPQTVDWITLSPKPPMPVVEQRYDELKCIYDAGFSPLDYRHHATERYVQPVDRGDRVASAEAAIEFVKAHDGWALSTQMHKDLHLP